MRAQLIFKIESDIEGIAVLSEAAPRWEAHGFETYKKAVALNGNSAFVETVEAGWRLVRAAESQR